MGSLHTFLAGCRIRYCVLTPKSVLGHPGVVCERLRCTRWAVRLLFLASNCFFPLLDERGVGVPGPQVLPGIPTDRTDCEGSRIRDQNLRTGSYDLDDGVRSEDSGLQGQPRLSRFNLPETLYMRASALGVSFASFGCACSPLCCPEISTANSGSVYGETLGFQPGVAKYRAIVISPTNLDLPRPDKPSEPASASFL